VLPIKTPYWDKDFRGFHGFFFFFHWIMTLW
jgi:hypothetical protein